MKKKFPIFDAAVQEALASNNLEPLLPLLLWLNGKPYNLQDYYHFRPVFRVRTPPAVLIKSGRQVGKSTSLSALAIIRCIAIPYHKVMFIAPLMDQVRNISDSYVKSFINDSPIGRYFVDPSCKKATLYKEFTTRSRIAFRYAHSDASRIRSYPNDILIVDELQDFQEDLLPVIEETLSASDWRLKFFAGTPLSTDNVLNKFWEESSKFEWVIKCPACSYFNVPSLKYDLEKMIGPLRDDISREKPAVICAKCGKPLPIREGEWVAENSSKVGYFEGYHIPQIITPLHAEDRVRWFELLEKKRLWPRQKFMQEVLGEAFDEGTVIISEQELKNACVIETSFEERRYEYITTVMAIDWGGGGATSESYTCCCVAGLTQFGIIEIPWGIRLNRCNAFEEAEQILEFYSRFQPEYVVHDFTGSIGTLRESILVNRGLPLNKIVPVYIHGASTNYVFVPVVMPGKARTHYRLDRTKGLQLLAGAIKTKQVIFFNKEYDDQNHLLKDFLSLIEERKLTAGGRESYKIIRRQGTSDDFAMTCTLACAFLWHLFDSWPTF